MIFEDWAAEELQSDKWEILETPNPDGDAYRFEEPAAEVEVEEGAATLRVNPFTRQADASPMDDFKHFVTSKEPVDVPESGVLTVETDFAVRGFNNDPVILRDAMAGFFLRDAESGFVFGAVSNGTLAGAVVTSLAPADETQLAAVVEAWKKHLGDERHKYALQYERNIDKISVWVDGTLVYAVRGVPAKIDRMHLGFGLLTLGRAGQALHEQGMELQLGPINILGA
jgi:hypothetical protein